MEQQNTNYCWPNTVKVISQIVNFLGPIGIVYISLCLTFNIIIFPILYDEAKRVENPILKSAVALMAELLVSILEAGLYVIFILVWNIVTICIQDTVRCIHRFITQPL